jgi:class 3 adenylate cyclase
MQRTLALLAPVFLAVLIGTIGWTRLQKQIDQEAAMLESIAVTAAAGMDGAAHARIAGPEDVESKEFLELRHQLRVVLEERGVRSPIYTLRKVSETESEFVVMTNETPFIGDRYQFQKEMKAALSGERARTGLYGDENGWWVSGFGPLKNGEVVEAVVCVDRPSRDLAAGRVKIVLWALAAGLLSAGLIRALSELLQREVALNLRLRRLVFGKLWIQIGLAAGMVVLVQVGISDLLADRHEHADLRTSVIKDLLITVKLGALQMDPALHQELAASGDANSAAFIELQKRLRKIKEEAGLASPMYSLRKDGEQTRFVVMTNETSFVGNTYELRPGVKKTLQDGSAGVEGPYTDSHGTWISAWAPIRDQSGTIIAVLQADEEVGQLEASLEERRSERRLIGLVGVIAALVVAALLARGIAEPVQGLAQAVEKVGGGNLEVRVPENRVDEVGSLSKAVNVMVGGLRERERIRAMFGKLIANQVVEQLLSKEELKLTGELREVTVLTTDIRGYTALTNKLGPQEIVALLNEYFSLLIDVVIEHGGTIDKFMGDALLCWFGAPSAQLDHAARAVACSRAIMERLEEWNRDRIKQGLSPVGTGIGLASGLVVVGNIGSMKKMEYTAIGDAVNLASRLCSQASSGQVLLPENTRAEAGVDGLASEGTMILKGIAEPVAVWRIGSSALEVRAAG